ncbi:unnamed protein product [Amoebophrya sp. A25]|nr:unnamed protein product [Amoebophrya sp. A25]|eukprot:GSA25T00014280001.1
MELEVERWQGVFGNIHIGAIFLFFPLILTVYLLVLCN